MYQYYGGERVVNLLHLCETMTYRWVNESEIKAPLDVFKKFARRNNFVIRTRRVRRGVTQYMLKRTDIPLLLISDTEMSNTFNFMDIADLHIGHPDFNENALREKLQYAVDNDISFVFIAGDIFEGCASETSESHYFEQIQLAYDIFKDYPLVYFAINGNHEYSFEQLGLKNPIERLEQMLNKVFISFFYFDTYIMDFIICGVIKRVMHVERQDFNKKTIYAQQKLRIFDEDGLLERTYKGETYPVRFFQVGHIHVNVQIYYPKKKIYISQPGAFLGKLAFDSGNIIRGRVINQRVFLT